MRWIALAVWIALIVVLACACDADTDEGEKADDELQAAYEQCQENLSNIMSMECPDGTAPDYVLLEAYGVPWCDLVFDCPSTGYVIRLTEAHAYASGTCEMGILYPHPQWIRETLPHYADCPSE